MVTYVFQLFNKGRQFHKNFLKAVIEPSTVPVSET